MNRLLKGLALALALLTPLLIAPMAFAQSTAVPCNGPVFNSVVCTYTSPTNTGDGSPSTVAAQTIVNATVGTGFLGTQPVKMEVIGFLGTKVSSAGTWTLSTSWGGNSLTIFSGTTVTDNLVNTPFIIECLLTPSSATTPLAKELVCKASWVASGSAAAGTSETSSKQRTTFTLSATPTQAVTVTSTFGTPATGTGVVVQRVTWSQGN